MSEVQNKSIEDIIKFGKTKKEMGRYKAYNKSI